MGLSPSGGEEKRPYRQPRDIEINVEGGETHLSALIIVFPLFPSPGGTPIQPDSPLIIFLLHIWVSGYDYSGLITLSME